MSKFNSNVSLLPNLINLSSELNNRINFRIPIDISLSEKELKEEVISAAHSIIPQDNIPYEILCDLRDLGGDISFVFDRLEKNNIEVLPRFYGDTTQERINKAMRYLKENQKKFTRKDLNGMIQKGKIVETQESWLIGNALSLLRSVSFLIEDEKTGLMEICL